MSNFLEKLNKIKHRTFLLPTLQEEVKYTRLDTIDASITGSLPSFLRRKEAPVTGLYSTIKPFSSRATKVFHGVGFEEHKEVT